MKAAEWALKIHDGIISTMTKLSGAADHSSSQFTALQSKISSFESALHRSEGTVTHFGNHVKGVFQEAKGYIAGAIGAYAAFEFSKEAVSAAGAHLEAQAQIQRALRTTHGVSGQTTEGMANQVEVLNKTVLFKPEQLEAAQQQLLTFEHIQGKVFGSALKASADLAAGLGKDLPTAIEIMGRALENPAAASKALREAHIIMTRDQLKNISDLMAAGKQQEVQQNILNMIMERFGGAAKTAAETGMGPIEMMMKQWDEFKIKVGMVIIDFTTKHKPQIEHFMHSMETAISKVMNGFLKLFVFIEAYWQIIKNIALFAGIIYGIVKAVQIVTAFYETWIIVTRALAIAQAWLNAAMVASPIGTMGMVVAGLAAAYLILTHNTNDATEAQKKLNDEHQKIYDAAERTKSAARDEEGGDFGNRINKIMQAHKQMDIVGAKHQAALDEVKRLDKVGSGYMDEWQKGKMSQSELYQQMMSVAEKKRLLNDAGWVDNYTRIMGGSAANAAANGAPDNTDADITNSIGSINGGGKSVRNISVTVQSLIKEFNINSNGNLKQDADEIRRIVQDTLVRVIQGSEIAISNE